jgi:hypothetical protein
MTGNKENLIEMIDEQIENIISLGDPNPTPNALAHIITDVPEEYDGFSCTYDEAFKVASAIIMRRAGIKLIDAYDTEVVASLIGKDLMEIADSIIEGVNNGFES